MCVITISLAFCALKSISFVCTDRGGIPLIRALSFSLVFVCAILWNGAVAQSPAASAKTATPAKMYKSLEEALAEPSAVHALLLNKIRMQSLPAEISKLENLEILILNKNDFESLPAEITKLQHLRGVYLGGSPRLNFEDAIDKLAKLPNLQGLGIDDNQLGRVPAAVMKLEHIQRLGLSSNQLRSIPEELRNLRELETLDLFHNEIARFPQNVNGWPRLKKIYCKDNPLQEGEIERIKRALPAVELNVELPNEVYFALDKKSD
jgi:Leucine-rich repeat (LRR) protein